MPVASEREWPLSDFGSRTWSGGAPSPSGDGGGSLSKRSFQIDNYSVRLRCRQLQFYSCRCFPKAGEAVNSSGVKLRPDLPGRESMYTRLWNIAPIGLLCWEGPSFIETLRHRYRRRRESRSVFVVPSADRFGDRNRIAYPSIRLWKESNRHWSSFLSHPVSKVQNGCGHVKNGVSHM